MDAVQHQPPRTRVTAQLRALRFDAGTLCLNLVATVGRRPGVPVERMGDAERLEAWCRGVGLTLADGYDPGTSCRRCTHCARPPTTSPPVPSTRTGLGRSRWTWSISSRGPHLRLPGWR